MIQLTLSALLVGVFPRAQQQRRLINGRKTAKSLAEHDGCGHQLGHCDGIYQPRVNRRGTCSDQSKEQSQSSEWRFELDGIPMLAGASETGYGEIRVTVAAWSTEQAQQSIHSVVSRYKLLDWIGDAYAQGWLERQDGKYLQPSYRPELSCRPERLTTIAALNVEPQGYRDKGPFRH